MPPQTPDPLIHQLRALAQSSPDLKQAARVYESILPLLRDADLHVTSIAMTQGEARAKLERGAPLLRDENLTLDEQAARALMIQLARAFESLRTSDERTAAARQIRLALEQGKLEMNALLPHVIAGDSAHIASLAERLQLDPGLLWTLAQNSVKPALRDWAKQLSPLVHDFKWSKGYCFICGTAASLGEFQGNDSAKHLRCGLCGADWSFNRLQCMYCGNDNHNTLGYLYPEEQREKLRVQVCENCKGYLKIFNAFDPTPAEMLAVEDLATLHLDFIAQKHGYARVAVKEH